jgi:hypothetical protein
VFADPGAVYILLFLPTTAELSNKCLLFCPIPHVTYQESVAHSIMSKDLESTLCLGLTGVTDLL